MLIRLSRHITILLLLLSFTPLASAQPANGKEIRRHFAFSEPYVAYRDKDGHPIDEASFLKAFQAGVGFDYQTDPDGKLAILVLSDPARALKAGKQIEPGEQLPAFDLKDMAGTTYSTHALNGGITVVDFFFVNCGGCIDEVPALNAFAKTHPEVPAVAITYDLPEFAARYAKHWRYTWPIIPDAVTLINEVHITAYPTLALVDDHGRILAISLGYSLHPPGRKLSGEDIFHWVESYRKKT